MEKSLDTLAWNSTASEFDQAVTARGLPSGPELDLLLLAALSNSHPDARYSIANFLLDSGAKPVAVTSSGSGALVLALSARSHDLPRTVELVQRLLDGGADPNQRGGRGQTPSHYLPNLNKFSDEQLRPLYDVWFAAPGLSLDIPNKAGLNAIELARGFPYRTELVRRMTEHADR